MAEHTTEERLQALEQLRRGPCTGSPSAVERHRERGKLLARERVELLLTPARSSSWTSSCSTATRTST
jgi:acetyl-CoA carboxylase carboxyltransferase component